MIKTLSVIVLIMFVLICSGQTLAKTYYVAFMGDSYGSGEGNPDVKINEAGGLDWADFQCHRSRKNGRIAAIDALNAELESTGSRIVAIDVACSGATVNVGLLGIYFGVPVSEAVVLGILPESNAVSQIDDVKKWMEAVAKWMKAVAKDLGLLPEFNAVFSRPKPPQIDDVKKWMKARGRDLDKLDAVVISVGGNDVGFGTVVGECLFKDCANNRDLKSVIKLGVDADGVRKPGVAGFENIRSEYARLDKAIRENLNPSNILITGYPDPLRDQNGQFCHELVDGFPGLLPKYLTKIESEPRPLPLSLGIGASIYNLSREDNKWIFNNVVVPLRNKIQAAANEFGWTFVGGLDALSRRHGYCATDPWFNTPKRAVEQQGDAYGTAHPNEYGYLAYQHAIQKALVEALGLQVAPPPLIRPELDGWSFAQENMSFTRVGQELQVRALLFPTAQTVERVELEASRHPAFIGDDVTTVRAMGRTNHQFEFVANLPFRTERCEDIYYRWHVTYSGKISIQHGRSASTARTTSQVITVRSNGDELTPICNRPPVPQSVSTLAIGMNVRIGWQASRLKGWLQIYSREGESAPWSNIYEALVPQSNATSYWHRDLRGNTTYYYVVCVKNSDGTACADAVLATTPLDLPGAPVNLRATSPSPTSVDLRWSDGSGPTNRTNDFRIIRAEQPPNRPNCIPPYKQVMTIDARRRPHWVDTGLENDKLYCYRVVPCNSSGSGPWTETSVRTLSGRPISPSSVHATATDRSVQLIWQNNPTDVTTWQGDATQGTLFSTRIDKLVSGRYMRIDQVGPGVTQAEITGLSPEQTYYFRVCAINQYGDGCSKTVSVVTTAALSFSSPTELVLRPQPGGVMIVSWTSHATNADSQKIDWYEQDKSWEEAASVSLGASEEKHTISGLAPGTVYVFRVCAIKSGEEDRCSGHESAILP